MRALNSTPVGEIFSAPPHSFRRPPRSPPTHTLCVICRNGDQPQINTAVASIIGSVNNKSNPSRFLLSCPPSILRHFFVRHYALESLPSSSEGSGDSCSKCPLGSYRSVEDDGEVCLACPSGSTTLQTGRWLKSQCVCETNYYDTQVSRNALALPPPPRPSRSQNLLVYLIDWVMDVDVNQVYVRGGVAGTSTARRFLVASSVGIVSRSAWRSSVLRPKVHLNVHTVCHFPPPALALSYPSHVYAILHRLASSNCCRLAVPVVFPAAL